MVMIHRYDIAAPEARNLEAVAVRVGSVIVVDELERVLVGQRHPAEEFESGRWDLPGGKCESGEPYEATALRELREEFGIALSPDDLHYLRGYCCVYDDRIVNAIYFRAHVESDARILIAADEFSGGGFRPLAEVAQWDLAFGQQSVIRDYLATIGRYNEEGRSHGISEQ